jgi:cyanophycinase
MKILILAGSGEFTSSMDEVDKYLFSEIVKYKIWKDPEVPVAIVPTAAGAEKHPEEWIKDGISHFKKLNARPFGITVLGRNDASNPKFVKQIENVPFIYFSGGNPGYLLSSLNKTPFLLKILAMYGRGECVLAGSSAGAMIMGSYILANAKEVFLEGKSDFRWKSAFKLINYIIFPHFDLVRKNSPARLSEIMESTKLGDKTNWIGIDENTCIVIKDGKRAKVMGKGTVSVGKQGNRAVYKSGQVFKL